MTELQSLLKPFKLKHLTLRNRIMSTSHAPGYAEDGMPKDKYQLYHAEKAKGGIALTSFGGSSSISKDSPLPFNQIDVSDDRVIPYFEQFAERVHGYGAAIMCQITHLGRRGSWDTRDWLPLISPSTNREEMHGAYGKEMEDFDFRRVRRHFGEAAGRVKQGGLDGCELIATAHHLLDAFLSPVVNKRTDKYGGSQENRLRFVIEVIEEIRGVVGSDFILGMKFVANELQEGGLDAIECLRITQALAATGMLDYINVHQGNGDTVRGLQSMLPDMSYDSGAFLYLASAVKSEVDIPVFHSSAIRDLATAARAVAEGHVDMIAMTRAHIADPHLVRKMMEGREDDIRQCVGANYCIDRVGEGHPASCIQNVSTGREGQLPHDVTTAVSRQKVVVVGGGPGGMEAARVAALRGHEVVLFEKEAQLGGQLRLARVLGWRENMGGISRWLDMQVRKLRVDVRTSTAATAELVLAENPDAVIIATGGKPNIPDIPGREYITSSWDILSGAAKPGENVLVYDVTGDTQGLTVADFMSERGSLVEIAAPDQMIGAHMGGTARINFMKRLHERDVIMTPGYYLRSVYLEGNALIAVLREAYSDRDQEREVTQIVAENGVLPSDELYRQLRPASINLGELDHQAFTSLNPQTIVNNEGGKYRLFRIGDAVYSRNIHAAMFDAARLMRGL
ncbi:NADH:flavin oxidoreductase [Mesorhizobium sp. CO1-1-8]|uniref:NADH:flavin oxidoreductase n=1 Tax=Mesorhizobium sp. CO1-1-8 TaxID=2876631 RepID=UPI001CD16C33|nr:NADH:flavin oxidoreductase [Mesorhizobium sp. CO1-1-8]MBZ9775033.1 NADH:flavin oxidoreductase [Mesorhizobium sp. CO1-1-8]